MALGVAEGTGHGVALGMAEGQWGYGGFLRGHGEDRVTLGLAEAQGGVLRLAEGDGAVASPEGASGVPSVPTPCGPASLASPAAEDEEDVTELEVPEEYSGCLGGSDKRALGVPSMPGTATCRYVVVSRCRNFYRAQRICARRFRGRLASIHDSRTNTFLLLLARRHSNAGQVWIGAVSQPAVRTPVPPPLPWSRGTLVCVCPHGRGQPWSGDSGCRRRGASLEGTQWGRGEDPAGPPPGVTHPGGTQPEQTGGRGLPPSSADPRDMGKPELGECVPSTGPNSPLTPLKASSFSASAPAASGGERPRIWGVGTASA
uniref:Uncharacterized protein n=1 Tax=Corvus moneduloides TaxID=1196302 RepID=A0A8C3DBE1_CORMO